MFKQKIINTNSMVKFISNALGEKLDINNREEFKEFKKKIKQAYKREFPSRIKRRYPKHFINKFHFTDEHGENSTTVIIFENKKGVMEGIHANLNVEGDRNYYDYSPTGLWFSDPAKIYEFKERIVYVQHSTLDC
jgi:hypothetical protein